MDKHPDIEAYVIDAITNIRAAGGTINSVVIASFFRGIVQAKAPEQHRAYKLSRSWCRWWFAQKFPWTYKKGTTSGQKLPVDWEEQVAAMAQRVSSASAQYKIEHPCFIINWDQTAVLLMQASKYSYAPMKEKQVPIVGHDEKRQITAVVASTMGGDLLPLQLIFKGQDTNKRQQKAVPTLHEVDRKRCSGWHLTQTANHWSSLESMKDYVRLIIVPWMQAKGREMHITHPHCVLLLDCWSVHKSEEFRSWMKKAYPAYHLVFVPAGCTGKAQPADVILQRPFKAGIVNEFTRWMTTEIHLLVKGGAAPSDVKVDTGLPLLKPLLVRWTWSSWRSLKDRRDMIVQGWAKCGLDVSLLKSARQAEAMRFCLSKPEELLGEEVQAESAMEPESEGEDEDEEKADLDVAGAMTACLSN